MPRQHVAKWLKALTKTIGKESANQEFRWMKQTLPKIGVHASDLEAMLRRRARGEPLQYILGMQVSLRTATVSLTYFAYA